MIMIENEIYCYVNGFLKWKISKHCTKNHISFFRTSWKDGFSKKIGVEYDLSCIIGKDGISFSRKYDLTRWTENEKWSFLKNTWKFDIFFRPSENMVFPKGAATAHDLSCIIWKDGIFSRKHDPFSLGRKWKTAFLGKYMETWCIAQRRKTGNLIYRIEVWPLLKFIRLEIFHNE